jgi:vacuolar-type H+-ATPase subunit E/Vma4
MDKTSLENAIMDEARQAIRNLAEKEAEEIKRLNDAYAAEIDDFKRHMQIQTDARITQESSRLENRANLDLKKVKLKGVEAFISLAVEEAMKGIRDNSNYKRFLMDAIADAVGRIPAGAEVHLGSRDLAFEKEIREALKAAGINRDIVFLEDKGIRRGGCIVVDVPGGRIFDSTIERIFFRKSLLLRREVMGLLGLPLGDTAKESSCKIS